MFESFILVYFLVIDLVAELEETFDMEIDAKYVLEENFKTKEAVIDLMKKIIGNIE